MLNPNRRALVAGVATLMGSALLPFGASAQWADADQHYGPVQGEPFPVAGINLKRLNPRFQRTVVGFNSSEAPGTIVIDPAQHFLYVVNGDGRALRYGVGVGRQGFTWSGVAQIQAKREWPDWYPPKEMIARDPHVSQVVGPLPSGIGLKGGVNNPLGARAMYLYQNGKDTLYRIHGTLEPYSIGTSVSSGCIRMINQDVIDLFERIPVGTKVIVLGDGTRAQETALRHAPETDPQPDLQNEGDVMFDRDGNPVQPRGMGPMDPDEGQY